MRVSKEEATSLYEAQIVERDIPGRPWTSLTWRTPSVRVSVGGQALVEVPKFSLHIVRRAIRILFFKSDEGP